MTDNQVIEWAKENAKDWELVKTTTGRAFRQFDGTGYGRMSFKAMRQLAEQAKKDTVIAVDEAYIRISESILDESNYTIIKIVRKTHLDELQNGGGKQADATDKNVANIQARIDERNKVFAEQLKVDMTAGYFSMNFLEKHNARIAELQKELKK